MFVSLPGLPFRTHVLVGRKSKEAKVRTSPQAPCTAPNQSARLKNITSPSNLPIIWEPPAQNPTLGVAVVHPRKHISFADTRTQTDTCFYTPPKHPGRQLILPSCYSILLPVTFSRPFRISTERRQKRTPPSLHARCC